MSEAKNIFKVCGIVEEEEMKNLFKDCIYKKHPIDPNGPYAKIPVEFVKDVRRKAGGNLKIFLSAHLESYGCSINRGGFCYFTTYSVDYILKEILFFKKHKRFRVCE